MARIITLGSGKTIEAKLTSIKDIAEQHPSLDKAELSYEFEFTDADGSKWSEKTMKTLQAKDWNKRFYLNSSNYVTYTRYQVLNALTEIFKVKADKDIVDGLAARSLDIDLFIGKKFNAVLLKNQQDETYCDWVETFRANGVAVPTLSAEPKAEEKKADNLPF
jgi:hypothetical protein